MTSNAVDDVPWRGAIVEFVWVGNTISGGRITLEEVVVAGKYEVDVVFVEERLECFLA